MPGMFGLVEKMLIINVGIPMNRQNWAFFSYCSYVLSTLYDPSHPFNDLLKWVYIPIFIPILQRKQVRPKKR